MQAIEVVRRYMKKFAYGLHNGSIYKKAYEAEYTYIHCSNVNDFLHYIMGNLEVANQIASYIHSINEMLSHHNWGTALIGPRPIAYMMRGCCAKIYEEISSILTNLLRYIPIMRKKGQNCKN